MAIVLTPPADRGGYGGCQLASIRAKQEVHSIVGDELAHQLDGLGRIAFVVIEDQLHRPSAESTGGVDMLRPEPVPFKEVACRPLEPARDRDGDSNLDGFLSPAYPEPQEGPAAGKRSA